MNALHATQLLDSLIEDFVDALLGYTKLRNIIAQVYCFQKEIVFNTIFFKIVITHA